MTQVVPIFGISPPQRVDELLIVSGDVRTCEEMYLDDISRGVMRVPCFWQDGTAFRSLYEANVKYFIDRALSRIRWQVSCGNYKRILYTTDQVNIISFGTRPDIGKDVQAYIVYALMNFGETSPPEFNYVSWWWNNF